MEKRVIIALGLSLSVLVSFQFVMAKLYPQAVTPIAKKQIVEEVKPVQNQETPTQIPQPILPNLNEEEVIFQNKLYKVTFSDIGAAVKKAVLNENPEVGLNISYDVFESKGTQDRLFLFFPDKIGSSLNNVRYDVERSNDEVIFTHNFNNEFMLEKRFRFHNSLYLIELELTWKNLKGNDITKRYALISGVHLPTSSMDERLFEISANLDGKITKDKKRSKEFEIQRNGSLSWVMLKNRYFSMIFKPFLACYGYIVNQNNSGTIVTALNINEFDIPLNSSISHKYGMYLGPSDIALVKQANIGVEGALTYGIFGSLSHILVSSLKFFHKIVRNWGIAILVLVLFINVILLPLTKKSYKSMQEMQVLQPKIEKLRKELKDNPQKLQKEIMELYKKYKINPMGGCLPMLLQMPIFIALYQGLMHSLELRGARFLWIKDLSTPENIKIPFQLPLLGNSINILPILMLVAMFFQQKLSNRLTAIAQTDEQRQQQKMMSVMMTVMFGFIFYSFPSGLVLYWLGNTIIMTGYQLVFTRSPLTRQE